MSSSNLPYEKIGNGEPVCIADEVPFEIPESWEWVRLFSLGEIVGGGTPKTSDSKNWTDATIPWLTPADMKYVTGKYVSHGERAISEYGLAHSSTQLMPAGSILYSSRAPIGYIAISENSVCTNQGFKSLVPIIHDLNDYLYYCLIALTPSIQARASGTTFKEISGTEFGKTLIPVPPLIEQKRIVTKIEEVLPGVNQYNECANTLTKLNHDFPDSLKKSILQWAVQGKLVPQDPNDEPASVLLDHIRAEKEQLIREGKIKRDKHESVIFRRDNSYYEVSGKIETCIDGEIPFEIPKTWEWVRIGSLFELNPRNNLPDELEVGFVPMPLLSDGFGSQHGYKTRKWKDIKAGFTHFADGDIVVAKITPCFQNRKSAVMVNLPNGYGAGTTELHVLRDNTHLLYMPYFLLLCKTHAFIERGVKHFTGTAGQQRVGKNFISEYLVPVPPLTEQVRIASAIKSAIVQLNELLA